MFDNHKGYLRDCNPKKTHAQKKVPLTLCPKNDQDLFSANHVNTTSGTKVTGINKMITSEKVLWSFNKFSQLIFQENVGKFIWRICMWIFGLKGLTKFCVFDLYTIIIYDLIAIVRYSKPEAGTTEREREREKDPGWVWSCGSRTKLTLREESFVSQFCVSFTQWSRRSANRTATR